MPTISNSNFEQLAIERAELRAAAVHEAGHAVLMRRFGGVAAPRIWPNTTADTREKACLGTCGFFALPGHASSPGTFEPPPGPCVHRSGMAGYLAEQIDQGELDAALYDSLLFAFDFGELSDTDMTGMGSYDGQLSYRDVVGHGASSAGGLGSRAARSRLSRARVA